MTLSTSRNHLSRSIVSKPLILAGCLAIGLTAQPAQAALTFSFNYLNPGEGFDDPIFGAERKAALNEAANALGAYFSGYTANLVYDVTSYNSDDNTLASAGSASYLDAGTFQQTFVQSKIINGIDENGSSADGDIYWNFSHNWGLGDTVGNDQYDFKSTAIHELLHSFGFTSYVGEGGLGLEGQTPGTPDTWSIFDSFLTDASGNWLIDDNGAFDPGMIPSLTAGAPNAAGVLFRGANALAVSGGAGIPIYTPNPWEDGSSIAHLDDDSEMSNTSIMNAKAHGQGLDVRVLGALELAVLKDIGYTQVAAPAAVPLPNAAWMMLGGLLAMLGFKRRNVSAPSV